MLNKVNELNPKLQIIAELKVALQAMCKTHRNLSDETIYKSVLNFRKRLTARVKA